MKVNYYQHRKRQYHILLCILFLCIFILSLLSLCIGKNTYSVLTVCKVLFGETVENANFTIMQLRLPRILAAIFCGSAFGIAGTIFQKLLHNPLASPDVIGVSSIASASTIIGLLVLKLSIGYTLCFSFFITVCVATCFYFLAHFHGYSNPKLILIGIGAQAFFQAMISWVLLKTNIYDVSSALHWLSGSLNGISLSGLFLPACLILVSIFLTLLLHYPLTILQLGSTTATVLGIPVKTMRFLLFFLALILVSLGITITGPLASISFLSGPIANKLSKSYQCHLMASAFIGILLILLADFTSQHLLPVTYPAGILTGLIGAIYFLYLLAKNKE